MENLESDMLEIYAHFSFPLSMQPPQHNNRPPTPVPLWLCAEEVEPWLNTQMANRKIAYTLGRGRAYISDMSSTSGYMGAKYFQEFGPRFLTCLQANS